MSKKIARVGIIRAIRAVETPRGGFPDVAWPTIPTLGEGAAGAIKAK